MYWIFHSLTVICFRLGWRRARESFWQQLAFFRQLHPPAVGCVGSFVSAPYYSLVISDTPSVVWNPCGHLPPHGTTLNESLSKWCASPMFRKSACFCNFNLIVVAPKLSQHVLLQQVMIWKRCAQTCKTQAFGHKTKRWQKHARLRIGFSFNIHILVFASACDLDNNLPGVHATSSPLVCFRFVLGCHEHNMHRTRPHTGTWLKD